MKMQEVVQSMTFTMELRGFAKNTQQLANLYSSIQGQQGSVQGISRDISPLGYGRFHDLLSL